MDIQQSTANLLQFGRSALADRSTTPAATAAGTPPPAVVAPSPAPASASPPPAASAEPSPARLAEVVKSINKTMASLAPGLEFSIDKDTNSTVVRVIDQQTKEVIRQMPSQEALEIAKAIDQVRGLLIREKI